MLSWNPSVMQPFFNHSISKEGFFHTFVSNILVLITSFVCMLFHVVTGASSSSSSSSQKDSYYCLVKGSPEALKQLLNPALVPSWYTTCYESLARRGLRVLALGYRKVSSSDRPHERPRSWVERDLSFGVRQASGGISRTIRSLDCIYSYNTYSLIVICISKLRR